MSPKDFPVSITVAVCVTSAALIANAVAGPKERTPIDIEAVKAKDHERFTAVDTDGDGLVSADEFAAVDPRRILGDAPPRGDRARGANRDRLARAQRRGIDREAIRERMTERRTERQREARTEAFRNADTDDDGQLSAQEYVELPATLEARRRQALFARLDNNDDGSLTPDEFPSAAARLEVLDADGDGAVTAKEMRAGRRR